MQNKENINNEFIGKTITFYSYKGGVGRSMSLVNIACLMAKQKKKVLLIDWDLEAPGLDTFFTNSITNDDLGLVDFITDAQSIINIDTTNQEYESFLIENLDKYISKNARLDKNGLQFDIIKAGRFDDEYTNKLNAIDWVSFYKIAPAFFRTFAQHLETKYDYILIDSRTGLADSSGICTMLMPQILVLVFALNNQNIDGVLKVANQSINYRLESNDFRSLKVLPLPSRIDNDNPTELEIWINNYTKKFEDLFKEKYLLDECKLENYFNISSIPYKSDHAYGENIPVLNENANNPNFISYYYSQFLKQIESELSIWDLLSNEELENKRKIANQYYQRGLDSYFKGDFENSIKELNQLEEFENYKFEIEYYNILALSIEQIAKTKDDFTKDILLKRALFYHEKSIELNKGELVYLNNLGCCLFNIAKLKNGLEQKNLFEKSLKLITESNLNGQYTYNLSCLYSVWNKKEQALLNLEIALADKSVTKEFISNDDDWDNLKDDKDFINLLEKY